MPRRHSDAVEKRIEDHVLRDLEPSWLLTHTKVALAAVAGGLTSLFLCGQFGYGLTPIARAFNHTIHESMGPVPCALVCGTLFALFPVAFLRFLLCGPLQFRAIMQRRWQSVVLWFSTFGGIMALVGHHGDTAITLSGWILAAVLAANLLAKILYSAAPSWDWRSRMNSPGQA